MSIVLNVVTPMASWTMTDGRGIDGDKIMEHVRKCQPFGSKFYIAYTGILEFAETAVSILRQRCPDPDSRTLEYVTAALKAVSDHLRTKRSDNAQFLVTGIREDGVLGSCTISMSGEFQCLYPVGDTFRIACLSPFDDGFNASQYLEPRPANMPWDRYFKTQLEKIVAIAAERSETVNTNTTFYVIHLNPETGEKHFFQC